MGQNQGFNNRFLALKLPFRVTNTQGRLESLESSHCPLSTSNQLSVNWHLHSTHGSGPQTTLLKSKQWSWPSPSCQPCPNTLTPQLLLGPRKSLPLSQTGVFQSFPTSTYTCSCQNSPYSHAQLFLPVVSRQYGITSTDMSSRSSQKPALASSRFTHSLFFCWLQVTCRVSV